VPTLVITKATATRLKANLAAPVNVTFSPAVSFRLRRRGATSRADRATVTTQSNRDIAAPGASVSAVVGTGDGQEPFGGTSGATPMNKLARGAAGAGLSRSLAQGDQIAADEHSGNQSSNRSRVGAGVLAPITRVGGGEVRVTARSRAGQRPGTRTL